MADGGHIGWPKITFDRISRNFRSIRNFFFSQNACWRPFWMTENRFRSHFSPFQINTQLIFSQNGCRRPFWMTKNYFWMHFSPFEINAQLFLFEMFIFKMAAGGHFGSPIWAHFSPYQINAQPFFFFFSKWPPVAILEVRFAPKTIGIVFEWLV